MPVGMQVRVDTRKTLKALGKIDQKIVQPSAMSALNRAIPQTRTAITREVAAKIGIKQTVMRARFRFQSRDKATRKNLTAGIFAVISDLRASDFAKPRQTKKGAKVKGKLYPGAFVATMPKGHTGVYKRVGKPRFPIQEIKIPIRETVEPIAKRHIQTTGVATFEKRFHYELQRRLKRL